MSASPHNASLGSNSETTDLAEAKLTPAVSQARVTTPSHEALQALLAFSSLHEQLRQRRAHDMLSGLDPDPADVWELEQFVLDEVLQLVAERALTITGADGVAVALAEGDAIVCRASAGNIAPDAGARLDPKSGFSGACLAKGRIVRCDDAENDPRVNVQACRRLGTRSMVAVPLAGHRSVIGLLEAFSTEAYGFNDSDVRSLSLLAELILAAMKPEEEDRLAEISRRVVGAEPVDAAEPVEIEERDIPNSRAEHLSAVLSGSNQSTNLEPDHISRIFSEIGRPENSRPGLAVVLLLVMIAVALGGGLWWKIRHRTQSPVAAPQQTVPPSPVAETPSDAPVADNSRSAQDSPEAAPGESSPLSATDQKLALLPKVTAIRHLSSGDSSTVIVDLQDQVQYEAHRLSDPDRVYIDLHDTALAPGLFGKTLDVKDALLARVRIAQPMPGVTRVVLETNGPADFSVRLEANPYRLVVEVRGVKISAQPKAQIDLPRPAASNSVTSPSPKPLSSPAQPSPSPDRQARALVPKFRIVLDAGHGGWDLGTVGRKGLLEKNLVLDIVQRLGDLVQSRLGAEVIYTRHDDNYVALEKRAEIANLSQANLFVSVHANYSDDSSARGAETYYTNTYSSVKARPRETDTADDSAHNVDWTNVDIREKAQASRQFASSVQRALYGMLATKIPGIRNRGIKKASYVVLTGTAMPAILAEVSFVSSPADESNLKNSAYRQHLAEALYKGIAHYTAESHRVKIASTSGKPTGE